MNGDALFMDALGESIKYYCEWQTMEEGLNAWQGTCGVAWILEDGTPADNGMNYCPRCGRPLHVANEKGGE